jgi:hypothetical protein
MSMNFVGSLSRTRRGHAYLYVVELIMFNNMRILIVMFPQLNRGILLVDIYIYIKSIFFR